MIECHGVWGACLLYVIEGEIPERSKGSDCKSAAIGFVGSNPTLPISFFKIANLAQKVERLTCNLQVVSSILTVGFQTRL